MSLEMPVKEFLVIQWKGNETTDECPKCGAIVCAGVDNIRWCNNPDCTWSNDESTQTWLVNRHTHTKEK